MANHTKRVDILYEIEEKFRIFYKMVKEKMEERARLVVQH